MSDIEDDVQFIDVKNLKSLTCTNVPQSLLDKNIATEYFGQFGNITRLVLRPKSSSCIVEYDSMDSAKSAYLEAVNFDDVEFQISYTPKEALKPKLKNMEDDPEVLAELNAMASYSNYTKPRVAEVVKQIPKPRYTVTQKLVPEIAPKPNPVNASLRKEYEAILNSPALTSEQKYDVLEARDKLIRLLTVKNTDIKKAVSTKGFCPDMCPEKERYLRESKHQVAFFELEENTRSMNHSIAVKQYSRSSADQESPLPHELRSAIVLRMTMTYLLHKIMDLCEVADINIGDWFHFLWDRTRSIRKDITQQELCSQQSVKLVEECARFHIHCSARLVAEEPMVFDQKINTENLTKCLQSLKYMYHDLSLKNEQCPNEAEFRAYVILLNLHDANFLWDVKQLPENVRKSTEIRFAINVYLAMESNNYVKFFKLVRETTYMNACILLRYFNQVRTRALVVILKSYTVKTPLNFSIPYLTYNLAFEDDDMTAQFLEYYGLQCDRDNEVVLLDKKSFFYPDIQFLLDRAINIVEHKRTCSVGEAIYGGILEPETTFLNHKLHNSFDDDGFLIYDAWTAEDQDYTKPVIHKKQKPPTIKKEEPSSNSLFKVPTLTTPKFALTKPNIFHSKVVDHIDNTDSSTPSSIFGQSQTAKTNLFNTIMPPVTDTASIKSKTASSTTNIFQNLITPPQTKISQLSNSIFENNKNVQPSSVSNVFGAAFSQSNKPTIFAPSIPINNNLFKSNVTPINSNDIGLFASKFSDNSKPINIFGKNTAGDLTTIFNKPSLKSPTMSMQPQVNEADKKAEHEKHLQAQKAELENRKIQEELHKKNENNSLICLNNLLNEYTDSEIRRIVCEEKSANDRKLMEINNLSNDILNEVCNDIIENIAKQELFIKLTNRINNLKLLHKYFNVWKSNLVLRNKRTLLIDNFPTWLPDVSIKTNLNDLKHPNECLTLNNIKRYKSGKPLTLNSLNTIPNTTPTTYIDVFNLINDNLIIITNKNNHKNSFIFWKLIISLPYAYDNNYKKLLNELINFNKTTNMYIEECSDKNFYEKLTICLKINDNNNNYDDDLNGLIFIVNINSIDKDKIRFQNYFNNEKINKIPVFIIVDNRCNYQQKHKQHQQYSTKDYIIEKLMIKNIYNKITKLNISFLNHNHLFNVIVKNGLKFTSKFYQNYNLLHVQNFTKFLQTLINKELWLKINKTLLNNIDNLNFLINLYNYLINEIINLCKINVKRDYLNITNDFDKKLLPLPEQINYNIPFSYELLSNKFPLHLNYKNFIHILTTLKINDMIDEEYNDNEEIFKMNLLNFLKKLFLEKDTYEKIYYKIIEIIYSKNNNIIIDVFDLIINTYIKIKLNNTLHSNDMMVYDKYMYKKLKEHHWWLKLDMFIKEKKKYCIDTINNDKNNSDLMCIEETINDVAKVQEISYESSANKTIINPNNEEPKSKKQRLSSEINDLIKKSESILQKADEKLMNYNKIIKSSNEISKKFDKDLYNYKNSLKKYQYCFNDE